MAALFNLDAVNHMWTASKEVADDNLAMGHKKVTPILLAGFSAVAVSPLVTKVEIEYLTLELDVAEYCISHQVVLNIAKDVEHLMKHSST